MKIAFIAIKGIDRIGGVETYTLELGKRLIAEGHEVIVYMAKNPQCPRRFYHQGMQIIPLPTIKHKYFEKMVLVIAASIHQFFVKGIDIVHFHAIGPSLFAFAPRLAGRYTVFQSHGHEWERNSWNFLARTFFHLSEKLTFWFVNDSTAVSRALQNYYQQKYQRNVTYIPTGITPRLPVPFGSIGRYGVKAEGYILYVGRLSREKRVHDLIMAYQKLENPRLSLVIIGNERDNDPYGDELHTLAGDDERILFTGAVYGEELVEWYSNAFVYVLPSQMEGLPITLLEAMSMGRCCIASDIEANAEAMAGKGILYPVGNYGALGQSLKKAMDNPAWIRQAGKLLQQHVMGHYTWALVTEKFTDFYRKAGYSPAMQPELTRLAELQPKGVLPDEGEGVIVSMYNQNEASANSPTGKLCPVADKAMAPVVITRQPGGGGYYPQPEARQIPFQQYWLALRHHAGSILLLSMLFSLLMLGLALLTNPSYTAKSSIKIETTSPKVLEYDVDTARQPSYVDDTVFYNTQYKMLRSRDLAENVINKLGIRQTLLDDRKFKAPVYWVVDPVKNVVKSLRSLLPSDNAETGIRPEVTAEEIFLTKLTIKPVKNSRIIDINFTAHDPVMARDVVQSMTEAFIGEQYRGRREDAERAKQFLNGQLDDARSKLEASEVALVEYARENNIVDTNSDEPLIAKNLAELSKAYYEAKGARIRTQTQFNSKSSLSGALNVEDDPVIQEHKKELAKLETTYLSNLELFKPNYPSMLSLQQQIDTRKRQIAEESRDIRSNTTNNMRASYHAAVDEERKLAGEITRLEKELLAFRDSSIGYSNLKRDVDTSRSLYEGLLQRLKEISVVETVQTNNVMVVDKAVIPNRKDGPVYLKYLILGAMSGVFLGMLFVLMREIMKPTVRSLEDLENVSGGKYQVLTALPYSKLLTRNDLTDMFGQRAMSGWLDALRYLKISLTLGNSGKLPQVLHVTSPLPGEGKSTTAISLATMLAASGKKVLLIDADLRKPTVHKRLNLANDYGLTHYLATEEEGNLLHKIRNTRALFAICAGPAVPDPVEMLSSTKMQNLLNRSRKTFDHIIIDAPPVLGMADSLVLSNRADGTILMVASDRSTRHDVKMAIEVLEKSHGKILGIVQSMAPKADKYSSNYSDGRDMISSPA
ncbi:MAG: polysaccharide biosynthesis tyrosine autokinase [Gammaproteobacteria bacterium]|nr:polysaccharide biosynthesis tyrosine autokinase [Gammaproteobacteria bacterium]MBU1723561.1 polysaccharide biosynthesis tyrosine autokinase [Gammaproteobacteria bacterium]MBU2004119.1 polysaccharide biosynthesis tyrosine autokinase [Gammaproteobacteria bacterium]